MNTNHYETSNAIIRVVIISKISKPHVSHQNIPSRSPVIPFPSTTEWDQPEHMKV